MSALLDPAVIAAARDDRHYVIVGNVAASDVGLRLGARVEILNIPGNPSRALVHGMSRGGRMITKYIASHRLRALRVVWAHRPRCMCWATKEEAEREMGRLTTKDKP